MTLTVEQRALRQTGIGSSEVAAVLGVDPYQTALDVYMEKVGLLPPFAGNQFTRWGHRLEPVIAAEYGEVTGRTLVPGRTIVHPVESWMVATPDFFTFDPDAPRAMPQFTADDRIVECKNRSAWVASRWGVEGTDEVPIDVAAQCAWQMAITGIPRCDVAVLINGNDFRVYELERDAQLERSVIERVRAFWFDHVLARVTPALDGSKSAQRYVKLRWTKYDDSLKPATPEFMGLVALRNAARARKLIEGAEQDRLEVLIKDFIGDALGVELPDGGRVTWKLGRGSVDWKVAAQAAGVTEKAAEQYRRAGSRKMRFDTEEDE